MGDLVPFPAGRVDPATIQAWATTSDQLPPGPDVPPRFAIWQGTGKPAFVQAHPDHRDPPGTIRWVVVQPDGKCVPPGGRILGR